MTKPTAIPLEALLADPGFERNCEILLSEPVAAPGATDSSRARKAITSLVISGAVERAKLRRLHVTSSKKGGEISAHVRSSKIKQRNDDIVRRATSLIASGNATHEICGILAQQTGLDPKSIRNILQRAGVLEKRK